MLKSILISILFVTVIGFSSCSYLNVISTNNLETSECNYSSIIQLLDAYNTTLQFKYDAEIFGDVNQNLVGSILLNNNILRVNGVSKSLGIEIFKVLIFQDSIYYVDRINKSFYKGKIDDLKLLNNYSYLVQHLSNLVLGRIIEIENIYEISEANCSCSFKTNNLNTVSLNYYNNGLLNHFSYDNYTISYANFNRKYLMMNSLILSNTNNVIMKVGFRDINKNVTSNIKFNIPKSYKAL